MNLRSLPIAVAALAVTVGAHAASLTATGYSQNFDSMGTTGTAPPADWRVLNGDSGTSNTTWSTAITANGSSASVASMVAAAGSLTATSAPSGTNNNGFNAAINATTTADRVLTTSPTSVSGAALELSLTNATGASFDTLSLGYDTVRFTTVSSANELPGYELFFSLGGNSWTNVASLNPTLATVPNSVGITSVTGATVALGASVAVGQTLQLRWVDDNAVQTSPDQIIGLNNVTVSAVPEPSTLLLMAVGIAAVGVAGRRSRG